MSVTRFRVCVRGAYTSPLSHQELNSKMCYVNAVPKHRPRTLAAILVEAQSQERRHLSAFLRP